MAVHLAGFHKTVIPFVVRCLGCVLQFPIFQNMQIIRQHTEAKHFILPELSDIGAFGLAGYPHSLSRLGANTEVSRQFLCRLVAAEIKQPCHKVDHIPLGSAAEAEEIVLIQL